MRGGGKRCPSLDPREQLYSFGSWPFWGGGLTLFLIAWNTDLANSNGCSDNRAALFGGLLALGGSLSRPVIDIFTG
jgi:hypothetical protein